MLLNIIFIFCLLLRYYLCQDLLDLINESYEPPDLDIPDSMMGNFGGGRSSGGGGGGKT